MRRAFFICASWIWRKPACAEAAFTEAAFTEAAFTEAAFTEAAFTAPACSTRRAATPNDKPIWNNARPALNPRLPILARQPTIKTGLQSTALIGVVFTRFLG